MSFLESQAVATFDIKVDEVADRLRGNPAADRLFYSLSEAANHSILWHSLSAARFVSGGTQTRQDAAKQTVLIALEAVIVNGPLKMAIKRERPEEDLNRPHRLRKPLTSSFPSGHASAAACVFVSSDAHGAKRVALGVLAGLVAWSRIHVRIHHGSDVVGGLVVGAVIGSVGKRLISK